MQQKNAAFRKRNQIMKANRTMFLWVAGVSVVFGVALVGIIFLAQMLLFNERVLAEKDRTIATLKADDTNINELESQILVLDTNQSLAKLKAKSDDQSVQVILDALPAEANSSALGSSLQDKLLANIDGLTLNSIKVDPVAGIEYLQDTDSFVGSDSVSDAQNNITFKFSVTGNEAALKKALQNLEKSIRTIDVVSLKIESQGDDRVMTVDGQAFYEPERVVKLEDKVVK
jgi:hypothetical protein